MGSASLSRPSSSIPSASTSTKSESSPGAYQSLKALVLSGVDLALFGLLLVLPPVLANYTAVGPVGHSFFWRFVKCTSRVGIQVLGKRTLAVWRKEVQVLSKSASFDICLR